MLNRTLVLRWVVCAMGMAVSLLSLSCLSLQSSREEAEKNGKIELARQFIEGNETSKAVAILQDLSRSFPENADIQFLYGLALLSMKDLVSAHDRFSRSIKLNSRLDDARLSLGYVKIVLGRYEEAQNELEHILKRGSYPFMERVHVNLGLAAMQMGQCAKALPSFEAAIEMDPTLSTAYFNQGKCLLKLGKSKAALESLDKAVRFCPGCSEPQIEWARAQLKLGRRKEAAAVLRDVLSRQDAPETHSRARALLESMGNTGKKAR